MICPTLTVNQKIPSAEKAVKTEFKILLEIKTMNDLNKDVIIGLMFILGIWSFISGQYIFSTMLFAGAAILSNIVMKKQLNS